MCEGVRLCARVFTCVCVCAFVCVCVCAHVCVCARVFRYSGLRGAVSFALALSMQANPPPPL